MQPTPFKLERYFAKHEFNARYLLCSSDCESLSLEELLAMEEGAEQKFKQLWLGYTESPGSPTLREEITRIYTSISADQVLVHSGAEEGIMLFMQAVLQPGDHVVVHWPCYQSLYEIARVIGCEVSPWEVREENGWRLELDNLKKLLRPNTRVVVINIPHNPTGYLMQQSEFNALSDLCHERNLLLFSDEVYRELEYDPAERLPAACDINPRAISLGVMSKSYGLAGLRIGWVATRNNDILQKMAVLKDYTTICNSAPSEFLAELALRHREKLTQRNLGIIQSNLSLLDGFFARHKNRMTWVRPKAGPIAFPRLLSGEVEKLCDDLLHESGVLLLPGSMYDHPGNHFRIGFARRNAPKALALVDLFLQVAH